MPVLIANAKSEGHDGILLFDAIGDNAKERGDQWLAFHSSQIKSATDNCGLYLKGSPCITNHLEDLELQLARKAIAALPSCNSCKTMEASP